MLKAKIFSTFDVNALLGFLFFLFFYFFFYLRKPRYCKDGHIQSLFQPGFKKKIQNHDAQNFILGGQNKRKFIYVGQFKGSCEPPRFQVEPPMFKTFALPFSLGNLRDIFN